MDRDRSFSDTEKVTLLAEIIKASSVPPNALLNIVYDFRVEPQWSELSRPPGRSPQECREAFDELRMRYPPAPPPPVRPSTATFQPPQQFINRPYLPVEGTMSLGGSRIIQPRPEGVPHTAFPSTTSPYSASGSDQPKKRGRPSNAELEARKRRGEPDPPTRSRKRSKASQAPSATSPRDTTMAGGSQMVTESSGGMETQRVPYPSYAEPSPSSAGPLRRSPGAMDLRFQEQRPPPQPLYSQHERSYSQSQRLPPPPTPFHTPTQPRPPQQEQPSQHHRLPSPPPYPHPRSMPAPGPLLPPPAPSPHPSSAPPPLPPPQSFQRPQDPTQRRTPLDPPSGEPMEH